MLKKNVLLIEDDVVLAKITKLLLESHPYKVDVAPTGMDALQKIKQKPDIILLDRNLPDMEGLEVCRKIRENKSFCGIPIIILSAKDKPVEKVEGLYFGADDYISKPYDNEELLARMDAILRRLDFFEHAAEQKQQFIVQLNDILKEERLTSFFQTLFKVEPLEPFGLEVFNRAPRDHPLSNPEFLFKAALTVGRYFDLEMLGWRKAIAQWKTVKKAGKLFLNCSPYLVENERFDPHILEKMGMSAHDVVLEVTERAAIQDYDLFFERLKSSRQVGLQIAVDDVGSGYASLDSVVQLRPNFVKIDMVLIHNINTDPLKRNIVEAIVNFCKKSQVMTIAEGIETKEELETVQDLGVDILQGYLLSKPTSEINLKCSIDS